MSVLTKIESGISKMFPDLKYEQHHQDANGELGLDISKPMIPYIEILDIAPNVYLSARAARICINKKPPKDTKDQLKYVEKIVGMGHESVIEHTNIIALVSIKKDELDEKTRLDEAFDFVPYQVKIVHSESESAMLIKNISKKLYSMNTEPPKFARSLYEKSLLTMILVLALRSSVQEDVQIKTNKKKHVVMDDIFIYMRLVALEGIIIFLERLRKNMVLLQCNITKIYKLIEMKQKKPTIKRA